MIFYFVRTAQALWRRGRQEDAKWVLDCGRENMPSMFVGGIPVVNAPDVHMRRKATPGEVADGVKVDSDGCVLLEMPGNTRRSMPLTSRNPDTSLRVKRIVSGPL